MTKFAFDRWKKVRVILNTLAGERHVQQPLLREVIDLASGEPGLEPACLAAKGLLLALSRGIDGHEFDRCVQRIAAELES